MYEDEFNGCRLGKECLMPGPHFSSECYSVEDAEEYQRECMRDTDEYRLGRREALAEILEIADDLKQEIRDTPTPIGTHALGRSLGHYEGVIKLKNKVFQLTMAQPIDCEQEGNSQHIGSNDEPAG